MWRKLLLLALSLAVTVLLAEAAARITGGIDRYTPYPRRLFVPTEDPRLPYRLRPGVRFATVGFEVRVNRFGLRGPEISPQLAPERERILIPGDSVVYGHLHSEENTLSALLERELEKRGRDAEVLNGGAPGYNTETELAFLENYGLTVSPTRVILGVSLNDFDDAPGLNSRGYMAANPDEGAELGWLERNSELYVLVGWHLSRLRGKLPWQREVDKRGKADAAARWAALDRHIARKHKRYYHNPSGAGWERIRSSLGQMADLARERRLALLVIIFPERDQLESDSPDLAPQEEWRSLSERYGLMHLDLWAAFHADGRGPALFQDVQHPNEAGMSVAAAAIADQLLQ